MTKEELDNIRKNKHWTVTLEDFYSRYLFVLLPLAIVFIGSIAATSAFRNDVANLKTTSIIILTFGLFLTFFTAIRLYQNQIFESYYIPGLTNDKIEDALKKTNLNNAKFYKLGYFQATTKVSWFSWGELITIIPDNEKLLINSRPTGTAFLFQPITIFKNRKNIKTIISILTNLNPQ